MRTCTLALAPLKQALSSATSTFLVAWLLNSLLSSPHIVSHACDAHAAGLVSPWRCAQLASCCPSPPGVCYACFSGLFLLTYDSKQDQHTTI